MVMAKAEEIEQESISDKPHLLLSCHKDDFGF